MGATRAIETIQSDAMRLSQVQIPSAIEACDWVGLHRLSERLNELAQQGMYHASQSRVQEIGKMALGKYTTPD